MELQGSFKLEIHGVSSSGKATGVTNLTCGQMISKNMLDFKMQMTDPSGCHGMMLPDTFQDSQSTSIATTASLYPYHATSQKINSYSKKLKFQNLESTSSHCAREVIGCLTEMQTTITALQGSLLSS